MRFICVGQYGSLHGFISISECQLSFSLLHLFILLWRKWALCSFLHNLIPTNWFLTKLSQIRCAITNQISVAFLKHYSNIPWPVIPIHWPEFLSSPSKMLPQAAGPYCILFYAYINQEKCHQGQWGPSSPTAMHHRGNQVSGSPFTCFLRCKGLKAIWCHQPGFQKAALLQVHELSCSLPLHRSAIPNSQFKTWVSTESRNTWRTGYV